MPYIPDEVGKLIVIKALSDEELDLLRKLDALHLCYPFKDSRRLRDDLRDLHGLQVNHKRVQSLIQLTGILALYPGNDTAKFAAQALSLFTSGSGD